MIENIIKAFEALPEVEAIMLGGSRATGKFDEKSDYDIYVYLNRPLAENTRKDILDPYCSYMEYSNHFWELEDDGILNNGTEIELIYRDYHFFDEIIENMKNRIVGNGYSTCFYDNLMNSVILFDKGEKIIGLQAKSMGLIDEEYVQAVIDKNYPLIYKSMPALYKQIEKAMLRKDYNSVIHRLSVFFEMYYDILFALNKTSHPGEKRLLEAVSKLSHIPNNFKEKIQNIYKHLFEHSEIALESLYLLSKDIEHLIIELGYKI